MNEAYFGALVAKLREGAAIWFRDESCCDLCRRPRKRRHGLPGAHRSAGGVAVLFVSTSMPSKPPIARPWIISGAAFAISFATGSSPSGATTGVHVYSYLTDDVGAYTA